MKLTFIRDWDFAHEGHKVEQFKQGDVKEVPEECAIHALAEGAAKEMTDEKKAKAETGQTGEDNAAQSSQAGQASDQKPSKKPKKQQG